MRRTTLRASTTALAIRLQEVMDAGDDLSAGDIRQRLSDAIGDLYRNTGHWGYYIDHFGDGESGDVIYSCDGDTMRASYEISGGEAGETAKCCTIDTDNAEDVVPRTVYEVEQDEADHIASMESLLSSRLYVSIPIYERFISKTTRAAMAKSDFAGKGTSFPIRNQDDVDAAVSSIGRAGPDNYPGDVIKANIKRIAKRKGLSIPKAWQAGAKESAGDGLKSWLQGAVRKIREAGKRHSAADLDMIQKIHDTTNELGADCPDTFRMAGKEAAKPSMKECPDCEGDGKCPTCNGLGKAGDKDCPDCKGDGDCSMCDGDGEVSAKESAATIRERQFQAAQGGGPINLVESATSLDAIILRESRADYEIKLIAPGKGSSAFYPSEVLKRDGPKVFKASTHVYLNHPTAAEEAARPEGDVANLAGVLTTDAVYNESHPKGEGLYARMKVFADHAQMVEEKAPHVGMSIRAAGIAESGQRREGLPVLKELTAAESVDVVTRAGAGGMILTEAARGAETQTQEGAMALTDEEKALRETVARLQAREVYKDALITAHTVLAEVSLPAPIKALVVENCVGSEDLGWKELPRKDGALDTVKFTEAINKEAKRVGRAVAQADPLRAGRPIGMGAPMPFADVPKPEEIAAQEATRVREAAQAEDVFAQLMGGNEKAAKFAAKGRAA